MALVRLYSPDTEPELVTLVAMLEAHDIPCFVHNAGIGSLLPGAQVSGYNTRTIMIPEEKVPDALELLRDFEAQAPADEPVQYAAKSKLRALLEMVICGWLIPGSRSGRSR